MKKADLMIKSKAVYTGTKKLPEEACIIIKNGKIKEVCSFSEAGQYECDPNRIITLQEGMVLPGFIDAHTHVLATAAAQSVRILDLTGAVSEQDCIERIKKHLQEHPELTCVVGNGWSTANWESEHFPNRTELDRHFPEIPVFLASFDGHTCWLNGKALEVCGITKETTVKFGEIQKNPNGEPTGILCDIAAISLVSKKTALPSAEMIQRNLEHFSMMGITSIADVSANPILDEEPVEYEPLLSLEKEQKLPVRLHLYPSLGDDGEFSLAEQLAEKYCYDDLQVSGLKQFVDGTTSAYSAALAEEYADKPGELGCVNYPEQTYKDLVKKANERGFSVKLHAIGDRAVSIALDAYEYAGNHLREQKKKESQRTHKIRNCIEHVENILPSDGKRFGENHVIASMQPDHLVLDNMEKSVRLGPERAKTIWPFQQLLNHGTALAFGSDYPVVDCDPIKGIYAAVSRTFPGGAAATTCQEERITLKEAIDAFTQGSAYSLGREQELGTIEPGKLADIVVLNKDLFSVQNEEMLTVKPLMTIMNGKIVYDLSREVV